MEMNTPAELSDFSSKLIPVKIWGYEIKFVNIFKLGLKEHLETLFMTIYSILFWVLAFQLPTIIILFTNWTPPIIRYLLIVYLCWVFYDRKTPDTTGRKCTWFRNLPIFRWYNDYFPIRLVKTADLTPDKNYLLVMYPHGIFPCSVATTFGFNNNNLDKLYPNIDFQFVTLNSSVVPPIIREYYLSIGGRSANLSGILYFLKSKPSKGLLIMPEGANHALSFRTDSQYFIEKYKRKGFMRIALETGTTLVPVFSFGENRPLERKRPPFAWYQYFSDFVYKMIRFRWVVFNGAGIFQQSFGILPRRTPITTVVGKPIPIPKVENPSKELIEEYLDKFFEALHALFEENKHKYDLAGSNAVLTIS